MRLLEKRLTRPKAGRADGLKYLTLEIFDALGIHDHVMSDACRHEEICHWGSDEDGNLRRLAVVPDVVPGLDEPREVTLAQGRASFFGPERHIVTFLALSRQSRAVPGGKSGERRQYPDGKRKVPHEACN